VSVTFYISLNIWNIPYTISRGGWGSDIYWCGIEVLASDCGQWLGDGDAEVNCDCWEGSAKPVESGCFIMLTIIIESVNTCSICCWLVRISSVTILTSSRISCCSCYAFSIDVHGLFLAGSRFSELLSTSSNCIENTVIGYWLEMKHFF